MDFETFIKTYEVQALKLDLEKDVPISANKIYSQRMHLLKNAEFESEVKEVLEVSQKAITDLKRKLLTSIQNGHYKTKYVNHIPSFLQHLRFYFEYKDLHSKAILKTEAFASNTIISNNRSGFQGIQDLIKNKNYSKAEVIQIILSKYPDNFALNLFLKDLEASINDRYNDALLKLSDQDILNFIDYYKQSNWELPVIKLTESEYNHTYQFIRHIKDYKVISNIYNFGGKDADFIELIYLNEMLMTHHGVIDWHYSLSVANEMEKIEFLRDIKIQLEEYLKPEAPKQNTKQETPQPKTDLQNKVEFHFNFFSKDCPRKQKLILKDDDFEKLIKWTVLYFQNDLKVPKIDEPIKTIQTNKTFVQGAFKALFNELRPSNTYPNSLFNFYKEAFKPFANDKKDNFDRARINDEVYKLMNIEY